MLLKLRNFILQQGVVNTQQLSRELGMDELALKPLLAIWQKKGLIEQCQASLACKAPCHRCSSQNEYYQLKTDN